MALLNELGQIINDMANDYNEPDLNNIIDRYCDYIFKNKSQNEIADNYVLQSDKEAWLNKSIDTLNTGHIFSGLVYDKKCNDQFDRWYNENYLTDKDINATYDNISDCIKENFDYRLSNYIIAEVINNGLTNLHNEESVKESLKEIDNRHDEMENDKERKSFPIMSREFEKAVVKTSYIIAKNFDPMQILEYISKNLDFRYSDPVICEFDLDLTNSYFNKLKIEANNNKDMMNILSDSLQILLNKYSENLYLEEEDIDDLVAYNSIVSSYDVYTNRDVGLNANRNDNNYSLVYGYVYDENGMHGEKIIFEGSPENIANFIMWNRTSPTVITDDLDQFVVSSTAGGFIDRVAYPALRDEILEKIIPLQMGDLEPYDVQNKNVKDNSKSL